MKKNILIYLALCTTLMTVSCGKDLKDIEEQGIKVEYEAVKSELGVNETSVSIDGTEQTVRLPITSNSYWTADTKSSWLNLEIYSGKGNATLAIKAQSNPSTTAERKDMVTISDGIKTISVTIIQAPATETITLSKSVVNLDFDNAYATVDIIANTDCTVSSDVSWCKAEIYYYGNLRISAERNNSYTSRTATVTVKGITATASIKVNQAAPQKPTLGELQISNITKTSAEGKFTYDSQSLRVERRGLCYSSTNKEPTTADEFIYTSSSAYSGTSSHSLSNLKENTRYYVRPYVITAAGTTYGTVVSFTTQKANSPNEDDNPTPTY